MNARLLLLMLVTAGFMAAWDGDQAAMHAAVVRREEQKRQVTASLPVKSDNQSTSEAVVPSVKTVSVTHPPTPVTQSSAVPLPKGIAPGTYQAVNQAGTSIRIDVDDASDVAPRDFYMVDAEDRSRWYLIRVTR